MKFLDSFFNTFCFNFLEMIIDFYCVFFCMTEKTRLIGWFIELSSQESREAGIEKAKNVLKINDNPEEQKLLKNVSRNLIM